MTRRCTRLTVSYDWISSNLRPNDLLDEYFDDMGIAYREEIAELYALGCRESRSLLEATNGYS
jgi:hypothetical protein